MTINLCVKRKTGIQFFNGDVEFLKDDKGKYNLKVLGIDYGSNYEIVNRFNSFYGNENKKPLSKVKGTNDLIVSIKKCFTLSFLKVDEGDYSRYDMYIKYLDKDSGKYHYINFLSFDINESHIDIYFGLTLNTRYVSYSNICVEKANDFLGVLDLRKGERIFNLNTDKDIFCESSEVIHITNLIECSVPKKRKVNGIRKVSEAKKIKISENKKLVDEIKEKASYIKSKYGIKKLDSIKSTKDEELLKFYNLIEESFDDMTSILNLKDIKNLNYVKLTKTKSHGLYYVTDKGICINHVTLDRNEKSTFYHEFGHHVYYEVFKDKRRKGLIKELISEIRKMETIEVIRNKKKDLIKKNDDFKAQGVNLRYSLSHVNYLLSETEIFARIFESYFANKTNNVRSKERANWVFTQSELVVFEKYLIKLDILKCD